MCQWWVRSPESLALTTCGLGSCGWPCSRRHLRPPRYRNLLSLCSLPGPAEPAGACGPWPGGGAGGGPGTVGPGSGTPPSGSSADTPLWPAAGDAGTSISSPCSTGWQAPEWTAHHGSVFQNYKGENKGKKCTVTHTILNVAIHPFASLIPMKLLELHEKYKVCRCSTFEWNQSINSSGFATSHANKWTDVQHNHFQWVKYSADVRTDTSKEAECLYPLPLSRWIMKVSFPNFSKVS